jgi:hypothetical protein
MADNTYRVVELARISATTGQFSRRSTTRTSPFPNRSPASVNLVEELLIFDECMVGGRAIVHAHLLPFLKAIDSISRIFRVLYRKRSPPRHRSRGR